MAGNVSCPNAKLLRDGFVVISTLCAIIYKYFNYIIYAATINYVTIRLVANSMPVRYGLRFNLMILLFI